MKSEVAAFLTLLLFTAPASWIAPPKSKSFSVKVVFPASGWEMIPKVLRFLISFSKAMIRFLNGKYTKGFFGDLVVI
jgi:hypothetical protein